MTVVLTNLYQRGTAIFNTTVSQQAHTTECAIPEHILTRQYGLKYKQRNTFL